MTLFHSPSVQSPKAYDNLNLSGPQLLSRFTSDGLAGVLANTKRTAQEISQGVTPSAGLLIFSPSPKIDPRRYGCVGDGATDDTAAMQTAINMAHANNGRLLIPDNFNAFVTGLSLTFTGTRANQGFSIEGMSPNGSMISQKGTPAGALITFAGSTPTTNPTECQLVMENFTISQQSNLKTAEGVIFNSLANFRLSNVIIRGFSKNLHLKSSLIATLDQGCQFTDGHYGVIIESNGVGGSTCNLINIDKCKMNINDVWGLYYDNGSQCLVRGCDLEQNGTSNNTNTGAIRILPTLSPDALEATVLLDSNWIENGLGMGILVDAPTNGCTTTITIRGGHVLLQEAGRSITVNGCKQLRIEDLDCATPGDTFNLTCDHAIIENVRVTTLTDAGITVPHYRNITTGTGFFARGRPDTATLTLTGVAGSITQSVKIFQQGDEIRIAMLDLIGTSNTTSCTITGLPAKYSPQTAAISDVKVVENNGADLPQQIAIAVGGTITLFWNGVAAGFTAAGNKGIRGCNIVFRLN